MIPTSPEFLLTDSSIPRGSSSESEAGHNISNPNPSACVAKIWDFTEILHLPGPRKTCFLKLIYLIRWELLYYSVCHVYLSEMFI